ncbi:hypothetical protein AC578_8934 [Pseudocercospora eumusae]|uniref:Uncharacterized protein n=1 Tax=Pseudocercospora eumusae TaxID=321146 RepID=A0A139HN82_9PEZI|nr:hypothetical protein AC578_8934 [Pseudocercospora eumusae]
MAKGPKLVNKAPGGRTANPPAQQAAIPRAPANTGTVASYASFVQVARAPEPPPPPPVVRDLNVPNAKNITRGMGAVNLAVPGSQAGGTPNLAVEVAPDGVQAQPPAPTGQEAAPREQAATSVNAAPAALVPSIAPAPTMVSESKWVAPSHAGSLLSAVPFTNKSPGAKVGWYNSGHCKLAIHKPKDFQPGDVIAAPYHVANLNRNLDPNSKDLVISAEGPVFSKRRMGVVLYKTVEVMIVLPLFSWTSKGIASKIHSWKVQGDPTNPVQDYVEVFNYKDRQNFRMRGVHQPLHFVHKHRLGELSEHTTCHITGAVMVNWKEDISQVGRITKQSFNRLLQLRQLREGYYIKLDTSEAVWPREGDRDWKRVLQKEPKPEQ